MRERQIKLLCKSRVSGELASSFWSPYKKTMSRGTDKRVTGSSHSVEEKAVGMGCSVENSPYA